MSAALTVRSAERRFVLLTALRWLPVGFVVPVTVLLAASRGLSPVEIGLAFTAHGVVIVLLELPTGGLDPAWTAAASINDYALRLTPSQARALADELEAVLDRWLAAHPAAEPAEGSELVSVLLDVVPLQEWPT